MIKISQDILQIKNFSLSYKYREGKIKALDKINLSLEKGKTLGLVGESACGKTSLANAILQLLPDNAVVETGNIIFKGINLLSLSAKELRKYRWNGFSMVFQAAMNALAPVYKVGDQIMEVVQVHNPEINYMEAKERVEELFQLVGLDTLRINDYPHQYSGGMKQRAMIAMALACNPDLIIADEATTALDVIVQDRILKRLNMLKKGLGMSMIYISHDIAVITEVSDYVGVMYAGNLLEYGKTKSVFNSPLHPYTEGLMGCFPSVVGEKQELKVIAGEPPDLLNPPAACKFHPRCPYMTAECEKRKPPLVGKKDAESHFTYCWHPLV